MAPSNNKPSGSDAGEGTRSGDIQDTLTKTRIAPDLLAAMKPKLSTTAAAAEQSMTAAAEEQRMFDVIIEFHRSFPGGISTARLTLLSAYAKAVKNQDLIATIPAYRMALAAGPPRDDDDLAKAFGPDDTVAVSKSLLTDNYIFAKLSTVAIRRLSTWTLSVPDNSNESTNNPNESSPRAKSVPLVYKIWRDHEISVRTVKCDAARVTFAASGKGIVWAVADTGIDATHPHFKLLDTTKLPEGLQHKDFTPDHDVDDHASEAAALTDQDGHGTHVAGIIAGFTARKQDNVQGVKSEIMKITVKSQERNSDNTLTSVDFEYPETIAGLARDCKLVSLKVLTKGAIGNVSNLLAAIGYIQKCNNNGRNLKIHGLNLSLGYQFDPEWFAAGQSPLCVEVDRLVRSGVCVVAAAGNGGYGVVSTYLGPGERAAHMGTIADPGNANLAITPVRGRPLGGEVRDPVGMGHVAVG
jgi:serine protease AprX